MVVLNGQGSPSTYALKLDQHKLISKMYEKSPNYKVLAKEICKKRVKSKVGLTDQYPMIVHAATNFQHHVKKMERIEKRKARQLSTLDNKSHAARLESDIMDTKR